MGEDVGQLLGGKRLARPRRVALVLEELLPRHATRWADKLARTALLLRHRDEEEPWQAFFVSAKAVLAGRPLGEIPLMRHVATRTADAYEQNRRAM